MAKNKIAPERAILFSRTNDGAWRPYASSSSFALPSSLRPCASFLPWCFKLRMTDMSTRLRAITFAHKRFYVALLREKCFLFDTNTRCVDNVRHARTPNDSTSRSMMMPLASRTRRDTASASVSSSAAVVPERVTTTSGCRSNTRATRIEIPLIPSA